MRHTSHLVRAVARYRLQYGRCSSLLGHNALICARKYDFSISAICSGSINAKHVVYNWFSKSIDSSQMQTTEFVRVLVLLREGALRLSNGVYLSRDELDTLIKELCTC